ncbi:MAG: hypothetical protein ACK42Z_00425 [Candidatus Kapaibacteriota bacterium]
MNFLRIVALLFVFFSILNNFLTKSFAQEVEVKTKVDTNNILIGDQINLELFVKSKPPTEIIFPAFQDSLGKFEIVTSSAIDTQKTKDELILKKDIKLTIFDSGYYFIPSVSVLYLKTSVSQYATVQTDSIGIYVRGIEVDTTKDIKDIKGIIEVPYTIWDYIPYILGVLGIILILGLVYYFLRKRRQIKEEIAEEMKLPPHIVALRELKELDSEKLWQKGEVKRFHTRLTEIIRKYIERRFSIPALEMISSEIITELYRLDSVNRELVQKLERSFEISDLVKFAKFIPLPDENTFCLQVAFEYVEQTKPIDNVTQNSNAK